MGIFGFKLFRPISFWDFLIESFLLHPPQFRIGLIWFYGISTIVGYLMLNPVFKCISNILFVNIFLARARDHFFSMQLNVFKHCYVTVIILHQSFVCTYLNRYTWYVRESFVGNFIFKWVRINLFTHKYCYCFYTVKWFQLLLSDTINSIQYLI